MKRRNTRNIKSMCITTDDEDDSMGLGFTVTVGHSVGCISVFCRSAAWTWKGDLTDQLQAEFERRCKEYKVILFLDQMTVLVVPRPNGSCSYSYLFVGSGSFDQIIDAQNLRISPLFYLSPLLR